MNTSSPRPMAAMDVPSTSTRAELTRCSRATTASAPSGALALVFLEVLLAQADGLRRHLHKLIVIDELEGLLQSHLESRCEEDVLVRARGADIGELLGLQRIDGEVVF